MALQVPSLLARLPRPLGASDRKCQFTEVYGVEGSKKRRRHEVAAAIDGEGINIYNINFPNLITSYALPPQSSFLCPPFSLRQKSTTASAPKRRTYCAVDGFEKQIQCFLEESETGNSHAAKITTSSFPIQDTDSPAVFMGIVPTVSTAQGHANSFDVVVVHKDGRVRRLTPDLETQRWSMTALGHTPSGSEHEVQASFVVGFDEAHKSLLRKRQDLVAMVLGDRASVNSENSSILVLVSHPGQAQTIVPGDVKVHLFSVPAHIPADSFAMSDTQRLRYLVTIQLPNLQGQELLDSKHVRWSANFSSGELSLSFDAGFINYDISQYSPEVSSRLLLRNERCSSLMRISPRAVIAANETSIAMYNTQYQSIQTELSLSKALSGVSTKQESANAPFEFISYYPKLAVAVAVSGSHLFAFDLESIRGSSHRKPRGSLLIDAVGKGVSPNDPEAKRPVLDQNVLEYMQPLGNTWKEDAERWAETKCELEAAIKVKDTVRFDTAVKSLFATPSTGGDGKGKRFPPPKEFIDPEKIAYLLSAIFSLKPASDGSNNSRIVMSFWPRESFQWLIGTGRLNFGNIQAALRKAALPRVLPSLPPDAFIQALADHHKGSVKLLLQVLRSPVHLDAFELATAIRIVLGIARSHSNNSDEVPKTLTHKPDESTQEITTSHNDAPNRKPSSHESEVIATNAIVGLNLSLIKLHSQPSSQISNAIRSALSNSDALSIINHLRHSLATGGYTSRSTEDPEALPGHTSHKLPAIPLSAIVDLLNACIDAIGPSGWISAAGFASGQESEATLIADMKSEISAALAGVEEATYLKGILREFIRCCETAKLEPHAATTTATTDVVANPSTATAQHLTTAGIKRKEQHNGAEIVTYDSPRLAGGGALSSDTRTLPLSLKLSSGADQDRVDDVEPSKTKVLKSTGEVKTRSTREVNYLKRKAVGEYSFERIIV